MQVYKTFTKKSFTLECLACGDKEDREKVTYPPKYCLKCRVKRDKLKNAMDVKRYRNRK